MRYMENPITGQVKLTTPLEAKRLVRYGWQRTTVEHWRSYRAALVQNAMRKHMPSAKIGKAH